MAHDSRRLIRLAIAGLAFFLVALAALHALNLGQWPRHVSGFVRMHQGWLWVAAVAGLGGGLLCLGRALPRLLPPHPDGLLASRLIGWAGLPALLLALFPTDRTPLPSTWVGWVHDLSAVAAVTLQGAAMLVLVDTGRQDAAWGRVTGLSFTVPALAVALGFGWGLGDLTPYWQAAAVLQRALAATMVGWLLWVALRAHASVAAAHGPAATARRATP